MSIDPNKSFGMKATNKTYTLEFRKDAGSGMTTLTAVDGQTTKMSFGQRFAAAWAILTGKKTLGDLVFPLQLRNADFYHMSYIHRPNDSSKEIKKDEKKSTSRKPKAETTETSTSTPVKKRAPRAKKTTEN